MHCAARGQDKMKSFLTFSIALHCSPRSPLPLPSSPELNARSDERNSLSDNYNRKHDSVIRNWTGNSQASSYPALIKRATVFLLEAYLLYQTFAVFRIRDSLERIRILGSIPLSNGSGSSDLQDANKIFFFLSTFLCPFLFEGTFTKIFKRIHEEVTKQ
jgi:hypothetical protein